MTNSLRERLQATLGDGYTLERELGGGGMARVFVAEEGALGRRVVVKVLPPDLAEGMSAARFAREIRLAARLQHPNIVPVLAAGEHDGLAYYTMPFVEGESLRTHLERHGQLPLDTVLSVLRDVARALEYAHAHGVVHRDVKPENILLSGTAASVADFGIAKAVDAARTATAEHAGTGITRAGTALGTPAYMAPEQAAGDPDVDARADIYAWGVVAYELLSGLPPFTGSSVHQLVAAHIAESPEPLARRAPNTTSALAALVMRCLEKDPDRRPQSGRELLAVVESVRSSSNKETAVGVAWPRPRARVALGVFAALVLAGVGAAVAYRGRASAGSMRPVLAVLPFENLGAPDDAYFADGLTDEVRTRLTAISGLRVIGGASARQYKGTTKAPDRIARELGATHLLTGTVRWERTANGAGRIRVSPELVRAADQENVWAEPVEAEVGDVFALQAQVAERVASALDVALLATERHAVTARPTANPAAYDAYLRGVASVDNATRFSAAARRQRERELEHAIALDSNFALAFARLAHSYLEDAGQAGDPASASVARAKAAAAIERAWKLDSTPIMTRLIRADYLDSRGDSAGAERLVRDAAREAPGDASAIGSLSSLEARRGNKEAMIALLRRAVELEPRSAGLWGQLGGALDGLYRYAEAIPAHEREVALLPTSEVGYANLAAEQLLWRADTASARRTLERAGPAPTWIVRLPGGIAGNAIWAHAQPATLLHARDTLTLAGYLAGAGGIAPELYHLMKLRHFAWSGRADQARVHADSLVALIEPALERGPDSPWFFGWFSRRVVLAEAYATKGRVADAGRLSDQYVADLRRNRGGPNAVSLCHALHNAAYVDVQVARLDSAVARLGEALHMSCGYRISRALLRADPSWAPLRGRPAFQQLVAAGP